MTFLSREEFSLEGMKKTALVAPLDYQMEADVTSASLMTAQLQAVSSSFRHL